MIPVIAKVAKIGKAALKIKQVADATKQIRDKLRRKKTLRPPDGDDV